jgi:hypothetical protein
LAQGEIISRSVLADRLSLDSVRSRFSGLGFPVVAQ